MIFVNMFLDTKASVTWIFQKHSRSDVNKSQVASEKNASWNMIFVVPRDAISPVRWLGCIITSSARYLGSITIPRRYLEHYREYTNLLSLTKSY